MGLLAHCGALRIERQSERDVLSEIIVEVPVSYTRRVCATRTYLYGNFCTDTPLMHGHFTLGTLWDRSL